MNLSELLVLILATAVIFVAVVLLAMRRKPEQQAAPDARVELVPVSVMPEPTLEQPREAPLDSIVIGTSPESPLLSIKAVTSRHAFGSVKPLDELGAAAVARLGPLLQSAPSLLVAQNASGMRLMEVVINGDLVRAADGRGLRAFALGPNGISEQARLFEVNTLQNLVNVAALWQVASVVVAQKYLGDISNELKALQKGVASVSRFLDNQRKARILASYEYLRQLHAALQAGEFPESARHELESCERELIQIQAHLMVEYRQKVNEEVEVGLWGTKKTCRGVETKLSELNLLTQDIAVCLETRIAGWRLLSLFPGSLQQGTARAESIQESVRAFGNLGPYGQERVQHEIAAIGSVWNRAKTVESRRDSLGDENTATAQRLSDFATRALEEVRISERSMAEADSSTHLLLHIEDGVVVRAEQRA